MFFYFSICMSLCSLWQIHAYRFSEHLLKERGEWILRNYSHYSSWAALSCEGPYSITLFEEFTLEEEEKDEEGRKYTYM